MRKDAFKLVAFDIFEKDKGTGREARPVCKEPTVQLTKLIFIVVACLRFSEVSFEDRLVVSSQDSSMMSFKWYNEMSVSSID